MSHCRKHPRYKGKRKPRTCEACWLVYLDNNPDEQMPRAMVINFIKSVARNYSKSEYIPLKIRRARDKEYRRLHDIIDKKVEDAGYKHVRYCPPIVDDLPVDNLDQIALHGKVRFRIDWLDCATCEQMVIYSPTETDPTWLTCCKYMDEQIKRHEGFCDHVYLEGIKVTNISQPKDIQYVSFCTGS